MGSDSEQPHIVLMGPPGAGKGTQSARIAEAYDVDHVTTGDALRANRDMETEYGTPREYMEAGDLVPDPVVNEILSAALDDADGFVLDGYPRNLDQAEYLDGATDLDIIAVLQVSREELVERLTGRRVCEGCGANYHVEFAPPESEGTCGECGGELIQREDDTEDTVRDRLDTFDEQTAPVVEFYEGRDEYVAVDGEGSPDEVFDRLRSAIDRRR